MKTFQLKYKTFTENTVSVRADSADEAERYWRLVQLNGNVDMTGMEVVSVEEVKGSDTVAEGKGDG